MFSYNIFIVPVIAILAISGIVAFIVIKIFHVKIFKKKKAPSRSKPSLDVSDEQLEPEYTTTFSPDCVQNVDEIKKNPQIYLEINIIRRSRVVDTFAVKGTLKEVRYKKLKYRIDEKYVYLLPTKHGFLMPTAFYCEGLREPVRFDNTNKGITGKALSLLYMPQLYEPLFAPDEDKYNLFIVIFSVVNLILTIVSVYLTFFHNGGIG